MTATYRAEWDGLRGVAVLAVLFFHGGFLPNGALGVDAFFVLSGYLITGILWRELECTDSIALRPFFVRRVRRLLPALAMVLGAVGLLSGSLTPELGATAWLHVAVSGLYLMNAFNAFVSAGGPLAHTWSLAEEAQYYLVWPLLLALIRPLGPQRAAGIMGAVWLFSTLARLWIPSTEAAYFLPPFHATGLLLGSALALAPPPKLTRGWLGAVVVFTAMAATTSETDFRWAISVAEVGTAAMIVDPPKALAWRPLVWAGTISYGAYLWQCVPYLALGRPVGSPLALVWIAATWPLAALSYYGVERRFLKTVDHRADSRRWAARAEGRASPNKIS